MRKGQIRAVALTGLLALAAAGCSSGSSGGSGGGGSNAPGVTAKTITIGSTQPLTGIAATGYSEIAPASKAYFDWVNAHGGINGRTINYSYLDDGYDPSKTKSQTNKLILQDKVFGIFNALGTPTHEEVVNFLNQQKVPDLFVASGCLCWDNVSQHPYTFGWQPDYTVEGKILGAYVKQHFAGKKIAYFYQSDDFGTDGVKGLDMEIPKSQVVARQAYDVANPTGAGALVQKLAAAKPDLIVSFSVPAFTAILKLSMLKLHLNAQLAVSNVGSDPITLAGYMQGIAKQAGANVSGSLAGQLIQGMISDTYLASPADPTNPWIKLFKQIHDQYIPKLPFDGNVLYGMSAAYTFAEALAKAGKNPTRDGIVKAIEGGLDPGPGLVPFRYSSSSHAGFTGAAVGVVTGTSIKTVAKPMTTDDGSGGITPSTQSQSSPPANGIPTG
jgi:ABC-type branched-subunit amino acid transport system substrate-binding protein